MKKLVLVLAVVSCAGLATGCGLFGRTGTQYINEKAVVCPYCGTDQVRRKRWSPLTGMIGAAVKKEYYCPHCKKEFEY